MRLLPPLILAVITAWYLNINLQNIIIAVLCCGLGLTLLRSLPIGKRYHYQWVQGVFIYVLIGCLGMFITWQNNSSHQSNWYGKFYNDSMQMVVSINEPLIEKERSFKVSATVESLFNNDTLKKVNGTLLLYFAKNKTAATLQYGDKILIKGNLQSIQNNGNPGAFNYSRYMAFQQTYHQVYLKEADFIVLHQQKTNIVYDFIYWARSKVVKTLQKYIVGDKKVVGITEALLIGYKEDLDKDTVQAYSNTGVVHIIAISGMHLGLIYVVLVWLFSKLPYIKNSPITRVILILGCLWLFSLITGAAASVLRSAVMFTFIVIGKNFFKQASIYNTLAASAFVLLCYNPYLLWDVGFQLSYFAVIGIVWLQKPITNIWYIKNKFLRSIWEMCAITIAAQIIAFPICIFYFHQFPTLFLLANLICVPLSTVILFAEILLLIVSAIKPLASAIGQTIYVLTWLMNTCITYCNNIPFAVIDAIFANVLSTILLYVFVVSGCAYLLYKNKVLKYTTSVALLLFLVCWGYHKWQLLQQQKIVIYNVSKHTAIDFIEGNKYQFYGDDTLRIDGALQNFNLKPSRILYQINVAPNGLPAVQQQHNFFEFNNKKIWIIDSAITCKPLANPIEVDVLLVTKNPNINLENILIAVKPHCIVFDGANSLWKIEQWKKQCDDLHLRCHITPKMGAYILNVP
ncbi:ComEC/Rec2 family competence protein [Ferruginibacter yonginensis]|uniref:ComEC/Rec2 family competence protein n=1 Tax=Ferruginibacter yonginensis TaxID=1310416 RepID=A0ABV8QR38_9BACT